jgi:predicted N-acyltransferase
VTYSAHHLVDPRLRRAVQHFVERERVAVLARIAEEPAVLKPL